VGASIENESAGHGRQRAGNRRDRTAGHR
jgi:hypothetical protein